MGTMRGLGWVAVLALVTLAGCRSASPAPRQTGEPPIAARQQSDGGVVQTSATERATACSH
jgi:hypothetical protein